MWYHLEHRLRHFNPEPRSTADAVREHYPVAIRRARDGDAPRLHDLAELDSAKPLTGAALVAVVDGQIWAAISLEGDRVIADPFCSTVPAVELLRLRVAQLRASDARPHRRLLARRIAGRARA